MSDESAPQLPATRTDKLQPTRDLASIPAISSEGYQYLGRFGGALVHSCFEQIGGLARMAQWADQNPTDFYTKLFPKIISRSQQVDVSGTLTIDDAITRLERTAQIVEHVPSERYAPADLDEMPEQFYDL